MQRPLGSIVAWFLVSSALAAAACSAAETTASDATASDAGPAPSTTRPSSSSSSGDDAPNVPNPPSSPEPDAGPTDDGILGTLSGPCGAVRAHLLDPTPVLDRDKLVFVAGEVYAKPSLSPDGQRLYDTANAGGSSTESEAMSMEVLRTCEGAKLLKTETEIGYAPPDDAGPSSITDILVEIDGKKVGVSVTRAYKPKTIPLTDAELSTLLTKKLDGIKRSTVRVLPADKWIRQILHVWAVDKNAADAVERVYATLSTDLKADTIVLVTETQGGGFLYCNPDPPLGTECN